MPKVDVITGSGSKELAHNLDFTVSDHLIRKEDPLKGLKTNNNLERLVGEGKVTIAFTPPEAEGLTKGKKVIIHNKSTAYRAIVWDDNTSVVLGDEMVLGRGVHEILHVGKVGKVEYRDPSTSKKLVGYSDKLSFTIFDEKGKKVATRNQI